MICNVDKTWTLEPEDIHGLNATVAKVLADRATSKISTFNTDRFVKYMYDVILDGTSDVQKALAFTRHVPTSILNTVLADPQIRKALTPKGYTTAAVETLQDRFANSLQDVVNFINEQGPQTSPTKVAAGIKALTTAEQLQPEPTPEPLNKIDLIENRDAFSNLPYSPLTTTGNEMIEGREWYYDFIKKLNDVFIKTGLSNDGTVGYSGVEDGIRVTMIRGGVPVSQAYPDRQGIIDIQQTLDKSIHMVVTDKNGNTLYFDDNYNVTTEDQGRMVYFPIRTIPSFTLVNGQRVFNLSEQEGRTIVPVESRVKAGETKADVETEYQIAYNAMTDAVVYLRDNPEEKILIDITGLSRGTLDYNPQAKTPISSIKNLGEFTIAVKGTKGRQYKYIRATNVSVEIPIVMAAYEGSVASKVADLLLNPVYNSSGVLITGIQKLNVIKPYTTLGKGGITVDDAGVIRLNDNILDVNDLATAKKEIIDFLTREIPTSKKDANGDIVSIKNQFHYNHDTFKKQTEIHDFTLEPRTDGGFDYKFVTVSYKDWTKEHSTIPINLDANGEVKEFNGYIKYQINIDSLRKMAKPTSFGGSIKKVTAATTPSVKESTTPVEEDLPESIKNAIKAGVLGVDKLLSVKKGGTVAEAVGKVKAGKKWFDKTELTFKDENGNTVTKKLSEVMPYTALFNVVNSDGKILADWTRNGITLYNGSDYTELYHEAWHGFTQMFLTPAQRQELYNGVKGLDVDINYYDHTLGAWKKMKAADLDFTNADHILYAEEYLADAFKAYTLDKKDVSKKFKNIFQKIWEALKALFSRTSKESITDPMSVPLIKKTFNNLYTGNLVDYTFNQANIQFARLNSGITAINPKEGQINGLNITDSLAVVDMINSHISAFVDLGNSGAFDGSKTSAYTANAVLYNPVKRVALEYAKEKLQKDLAKIQTEIEELPDGIAANTLIKKAAILTTAIENFGDTEDIQNNKTDGVLAFYNKRTNFLNLEAKLLDEPDGEDQSIPEVDGQGNVVSEGKGRDGLSAGSGNEYSAYDRLPAVMIYVMGSIYERTVVDSKVSPDGFMRDKYGTKKTVLARTMYNLLSSKLEGITDREKMYDKLDLESKKNLQDGSPDPKAQMIKQFLNKMGSPKEGTELSQTLWNNFYNSVRYDRVPGVQVTVKQNANTGKTTITVGNTDGSKKALTRKLNSLFVNKRTNPSSFIKVDQNNVLMLDVEKLRKKYPSVSDLFVGTPDKVSSNIIGYLNDWGFTVTPSSEFINDIIKSKFIPTFHNYTAKPLYTSLDEGRIVEITSLDGLMNNQAKTFNLLLNAEVKSNPEYTDYMGTDSNGNSVSERFNPSGVGTMIADVNEAKNFNDVINQPHLSQFNPQKNAYMKASQIFKKMFGTGGARIVSLTTNTPVTYKFDSHYGTQHLEGEGELSTLISGMASSASDAETATFRDFWMYNLNGTSEAYKHADKRQVFVGKLEGTDPNGQFYILPTLFLEKTASTNKGREAGNKIIVEYLAAEIERIRRVQKDNALVTGEKADDVILYGKNGKYTTFKETASKFSIFDEILDTELKEKLLNDTSLQTYEDVIKAMKTNVSLFQDVNDQINSFMSGLIEADKQAVGALQFAPADSIFDSLKRTFGTTVNSEDRYDAAIENYTYSSFIHRVELEILVYGDLALYNHDKDEHMKRIAAFFATGKVPVMDESYNAHMAKTPGQYAQSEWFKSSNLIAPDPGSAEGIILDTAVLEDPLEDSVYFKIMVDNYMKSKGWPLEDKDKRDIAERTYSKYKDMKVGDAQGWISFDAYRALERRLNNWSPYKDALYRDILAGKEVDADLVQAFFPVKKMQYAGPLGTENFAVNGFHKYSLMPLIPSMIKGGTRLEKLHNKMVSQGIAYTVMHSGSKLASLGKSGKLDLFYKNAKGQKDPAFVDANYAFTKNPIFLQYLKEQVITQDTLKGKVKMPSQPRKLLTAGMRDAGVPMDFKPEIKDVNARRKAWFALKTDAAKAKESKLYEIEKTYIKGIDKIIEISTKKLKMELGYKDPNSKGAGGKPNLNKLVEFIKEQFTTRAELSEYDIDFIKVGSNGELVYPLDLSSNPAQVEKLITALINKRIFDQVLKGEAYIQGSGVGFERFARPSVEDLENYGTGGLRFYTLGPDGRILPMQVKIPLNGDFTKLLDLNDLDGKKIGTLERLNALLKNEEWLNKNDHRKMITMFGARIPTQGMNSLEAMEVAEFLPAAAGNIMILPLEMVAKSGGDFDIDKLVVITPVIKNNQGNIELSRATKTRKLLKTVIDEKEEIYNQLRDVRKKYIKKDLQPEFEVEIVKEQEEQRLAKEAFDNNYKNDYYLGGSLDNYINRLDNAQKKIDALYEQLKQEKKEVFAGEFDKYIAAVAPLTEKLRELNRQQDSYSPSAYQNGLLDSMLDIMLRGDNYVNLTIPNDTSIYTGDSVSENPVEVFGSVNRQYRPLKKSPTNVLTNAYNTAKAIAIQAGKVGIGMTATGNTFFSLFKQVGLSLNAVNKVVKKGAEYNIQQKLRLAHNKYIDDNGNVVISMSNTMDADNVNDIADTISQLMNGYLDVAKEDWVFDINASKELEPELEFMLMAGVPVNTAVGMLSQPLVREYLRLVKQYSSPYDNVRRNKTEPITFAKYRALKEIMTRANLIKEDSSPKTEDLLKIASERLDSAEGLDFSYSALKANKNKGTYNNSSVLSFLHFMEISYMSKGLSQLKSSLNVDTARNNTVTKIYHSKNKIQSLSNVFDRSGIDALMEETVLSSFLLHDVFIDSVAALLPLRASSVINNFINDRVKNSNMDMDEREIYQNSFINDLPSYIYANRSGLFSTSEDSYQGIGVNATVDIKLQPILKFGAFYNQETQTLDADINAIDKDYASGAFSESGYGLGVLATLPKDTFTSYGTKGKTAYRNFVYERELLRSALPYSTISENKEFQLFNRMRNADLRITATENENLPMRYEEFIRNKALQNLNIDKALFRTAKKEGIYSIADQFLNLVAEEDLVKNYPVLSTLQKKTDRVSTMSFVAPALKEKDGQLVTSYVSQMLELMNPNEMKSADNNMNMVISEFFTKLQTVAFLQAGNNPYSGLYMTNYFDQTAVAEIMREPFGKFLTAINDPGMATALLEDYALKLDQKLGAANKNKFVNYVIKDTSRLKGGKVEVEEQQIETKTISEPYGVIVAETNPSEIKTQEFVRLIQPQIQAQAYKENASGTANDMFMYGLRWTRKSTAKAPLNNKSYANGGLATTDAKAKDNYVYDTVDQNGNPLAPVSNLQPIIEEIQNTLGIDMSNYDAVIGNIYLPGQNIATHRDTTESLSARNYPVVVYTIGNNSGIGIYEDKNKPGSPSFASDSRKEIPTKNGSIYTFGMDGKGRFELAHDTPKGVKRDQKFPPITLPNGTVVENYTITLTFRRAADLKPGMPSAPAKLTTQLSTSVKREYTPENITSLKPNEVFVFGSNTEGKHGKGAAKTAVDNFGAKYGQAEGPQGQSYAIVTKNLKQGERSNDLDPKGEYNALDYIDKQIGDLIAYATKNPDKKFYVTKLGTMLAGWTTKEIGEIWNNQGIIPNNIILPEEFENFVDSVNRETFTQPSTSVKPTVKDLSRWADIKDATTPYTDKGIVVTRIANTSEHFGNPFIGSKRRDKQGNLIESKVDNITVFNTIDEADQAYRDWLSGTKHQNIQPLRREWILDQINEGKLDGKTLLYYKPMEVTNNDGTIVRGGYHSHADTLAEIVEELRSKSTQPSTSVEVTEVTKFPDLIQPSKISVDVVNYDTGELYPPIMTYNTDKFIKAGTFTLEVSDVETIFDENPNSVIVFDNTYPTATGTVDSAPRMNTPYAWRAGLATGKSFGINTRTISGIVPTDDNFDKAKEILDKQLDELIAMRDLGKTILFPSTGVGQNLMGLTMGTDGKYVRGNTVPAPSLFVYLSKRLLQDFGYTNPTFSLIETKSIYDTSILEDRTGMEFIQNFYKEKGMQTTTDSDVLEHIRTCKGK